MFCVALSVGMSQIFDWQNQKDNTTILLFHTRISMGMSSSSAGAGKAVMSKEYQPTGHCRDLSSQRTVWNFPTIIFLPLSADIIWFTNEGSDGDDSQSSALPIKVNSVDRSHQSLKWASGYWGLDRLLVLWGDAFFFHPFISPLFHWSSFHPSLQQSVLIWYRKWNASHLKYRNASQHSPLQNYISVRWPSVLSK